MILVTGATGTVGREVVAQLLSAGKPVRALTRDPQKAHFDPKVQAVAGDLSKPDTLDKALEGVDRVFSLSLGPDMPVNEANLAKAAKKAGAKHIVKLSVMGAGQGLDNPSVQWHDAGEKAIQDTGLTWTFVRPGMFMSNALAWAGMVKGQSKIFLPYGDGKIVPIHPKDIAAVSVKALTEPGHEGKAYSLTGSESLGVAEMAKVLSDAVGKTITYVPIPDEAARDNMLKAGLSPVLVGALLKWAAVIREGKGGTPMPTVEQVLGRKALTWREWVQENAAAFK